MDSDGKFTLRGEIVACADFETLNAARRPSRLVSVHARIEEGTAPQKPLESLN